MPQDPRPGDPAGPGGPSTQPERDFFDLYAHGFVRAALAVPRVHLAEPDANAREVERLWSEAERAGAALVAFPELCLSGYSLDDLLQQDALLDAVRAGLQRLVRASAALAPLAVVGAPLRFQGRLFNCAVVLSRGRVLGVIPKTYLPNYREFYEKRHFASARDAACGEVELCGCTVPFGSDLIFRDRARPDFALAAELCEDLWAPIPPSTYAAFGGATLLVNLSASNATIGKAAYRRELVASQSAKTLSAYLYVAAGPGESTTDLAWDGHALAAEDGEILVEAPRFAGEGTLALCDLDLERLVQERARQSSFVDCASVHAPAHPLRSVSFEFEPPARRLGLQRHVARHPFVPSTQEKLDERCEEAYRIQVAGLEQRLRASGIAKIVLGLSGGLDSTQALLVAVRAMDVLSLPRENVLTYGMPGFATSEHTRQSARDLARAVGVPYEEIDIRPSAERMLADIGHPYARGERRYDVTFENVQAGERTSHLFRLANLHGALVLGTGDLSELALGWCTYGVGDHMSHYAVNVSVPKTLVRHLIRWVAARSGEAALARVLERILATPVTPELVPSADGRGSDQRTEDAIGPYDLHDFTLYYATRRGYRPSKIAFLEACAWARDLADAPAAGAGPGADSPYDCAAIFDWMRVFLARFFGASQFKRSAIPNGPKVGSGGSLSPRGDWRAPSDASAAVWLAELERARSWMERSAGRGSKAKRAL